MNKITIADAQGEMRMEDIKVSYVTNVPQVFKVLNEAGEVVDVTLNIAKEMPQVTLQQIDVEIESLQHLVGNFQSQINALQKKIEEISANILEKQGMRDEIAGVVAGEIALRAPVQMVNQVM